MTAKEHGSPQGIAKGRRCQAVLPLSMPCRRPLLTLPESSIAACLPCLEPQMQSFR